ncbi:MAG: site-specific integrase [Candidatus Omnitrophica bacterium]|nr:site-specific integrase [Candidatus Omnitrophota bacterium]
MKTGYVYRRKGKWVAAVPDANRPGGYYRKSGFLTKGKARDYLYQRRERIENLQTGLPTKGNYLYRLFFEEYIHYIGKNYAYETLKTYRGVIKSFLIFMKTKYPRMQWLSELKLKVFEDYKIWLKDTKHKSNTVNNHLKTFKAMFNVAIKWEYMEKNPMKYVECVNVDDEKIIVALDTKERFQLFFDRCRQLKPEYYPHYYCSAKLGLRLGEMVTLEWSDVDLERNMIKITRKDTFSPKGRNKKDKKPKERIIPFASDVREMLLTLPKTNKKIFLKQGRPISRKDKSLRRWIVAIVRGTELEGMTRFHELRHTTGHILALHHNIHEIKEFLGHADLKTTMRYVKVADETKVRMAETLGKFGFATPPTTHEKKK